MEPYNIIITPDAEADLLELRNDPHKRADHADHTKRQHDARIDERALHLAADRVIALVVIHEPAQHLHHRARRLARLDHVAVERLERLRMVLHRLGERLAVDDAIREVLAHQTLRGTLVTLVGQGADDIREYFACAYDAYIRYTPILKQCCPQTYNYITVVLNYT